MRGRKTGAQRDALKRLNGAEREAPVARSSFNMDAKILGAIFHLVRISEQRQIESEAGSTSRGNWRPVSCRDWLTRFQDETARPLPGICGGADP